MRNTINSGRKFCCVSCALILAWAGSGQLRGAGGLPGRIRARDLKLTLVVYDYAHVSGPTLADAENTVSEIFRRAGVQLIWRDGFKYAAERQNDEIPAPMDPTTLVITLQPASEAAHWGVRPESEGIALGSRAIVFVRTVASRSTPVSAATHLGYVIAHELGHILLGPNAHSIDGIMRGTLFQEDWAKAAQGTLSFLPSQNQQIRAWIAKRIDLKKPTR